MTTWMHQLMSQGNQVVETTPGHSQKLLKTPETVNLTEKSGSSQQRHNRQHNDGKVTSLGSLLGMPVKLSNRIANKKNQTYIHKGSLGIYLAAMEVLHREKNLNSSQQVWYVGIQQ